MVRTPISALQEYSQKKRLQLPEYNIIESGRDIKKNAILFTCTVKLDDKIANGSGYSKKEAKHSAATTLLDILQSSDVDIPKFTSITLNSLEQALDWNRNNFLNVSRRFDILKAKTKCDIDAIRSSGSSNALNELRDLCWKIEEPMPTFKVIAQNESEFIIKCHLLLINRFGIASTKSHAKQIASNQILNIVKNLLIFSNNEEQLNYDDCYGVDKYLNSSKSPIQLLFDDRKYYYKYYDDVLKSRAIDICENVDFKSNEDKALKILEALKIEYKKDEFNTKCGVFVQIQLKCEYDPVFGNLENQIWDDIIQYFKFLLN